MTRPTLIIALAAATALPARAQESIAYDWSFVEVTTGTDTPVSNPDGRIQPGESARLELTSTIVPGIGSAVTYTPPPGPGVGTIAGLGQLFFDVIGTRIQGTWSFIGRDPAFSLGQAGTPDPTGTVSAIQAGQLVLPGGTANPTNPVPAVWHGVWTPNIYWQNTAIVTSRIAGQGWSASAIYIQYGLDPQTNSPLYVGQWISSSFHSVQIPIVPAPSVVPAVGVLAFSFLRKRSRK